ncbi:MAG: hypothetical protein OQJ96_06145 [Flavobacteriales bacterium]|nr:hypothetical protein [Flavobacteriales bacterium]MCW8937659.1 hypothetical protein [Flavobacteriales bacterium]MCW8940521.1 hypothetical protein [Flavobacteriales bacterium]MCW8967579.1 hypothetical protein [Flavobacteriales bacterium]MCW8990147.1 hypothetical protein [Flavobacteriales bacterium]
MGKEVLILSKTHVGVGFCVGGIVLDNKQQVRLMCGLNEYQPGNTPFEIGQIWDIEFEEYPDIPPHIEDVYVRKKNYLRDINNIVNFINTNYNIWRGSPDTIFDGYLGWTGNGSGYLNHKSNLPAQSVGFWIPDRDLKIEGEKYVYEYKRPYMRNKHFPYKGAEPMKVIIAGTLCRVSLGRWWSPDEREKRCYLQLSGQY